MYLVSRISNASPWWLQELMVLAKGEACHSALVSAFLFCFCGAEDWVQGFMRAGQVCCHWGISPALSVLFLIVLMDLSSKHEPMPTSLPYPLLGKWQALPEEWANFRELLALSKASWPTGLQHWISGRGGVSASRSWGHYPNSPLTKKEVSIIQGYHHLLSSSFSVVLRWWSGQRWTPRSSSPPHPGPGCSPSLNRLAWNSLI
jgi:hypothetical protein